MQWYVIHTHPNKEYFSQNNLNRQNFITYFPKYKKIISTAGKLKTIVKPLFPRYIFVKMDLKKQRWPLINATYGVKKLLSMGNEPLQISNEIIKKIKSRENGVGITDIVPDISASIGDSVTIVSGVFAGKNAIFDGLTDDKRVKLLFNLLGRDITLSLAPFSIAR
jgi:transcriptional antiterminator RfaH